MKSEDIIQANRIEDLINKEKTTVFIDIDSGAELTTRVAS